MSIESENKTLLSIAVAGIVDQAVKSVGNIHPSAVGDILNRAMDSYRVLNGRLVPMITGTNSISYGDDGVTPATGSEWLRKQIARSPHWLQPDARGGKQGGGEATSQHSDTQRADTWSPEEKLFEANKKHDPANKH